MRRFIHITNPGNDSLPYSTYEEITDQEPERVFAAIYKGYVKAVGPTEDAVWQKLKDEKPWLLREPLVRIEEIEIVGSVYNA